MSHKIVVQKNDSICKPLMNNDLDIFKRSLIAFKGNYFFYQLQTWGGQSGFEIFRIRSLKQPGSPILTQIDSL